MVNTKLKTQTNQNVDKLKLFYHFNISKMDNFREHEMHRFVINKGMKLKEDSTCYVKRIQELDDSFKAPTECIPEIIPYLRIFYSFSDSHDKYIDDRILYYEGMIQYEIIPRVPKNVLRRRQKIQTKLVD